PRLRCLSLPLEEASSSDIAAVDAAHVGIDRPESAAHLAHPLEAGHLVAHHLALLAEPGLRATHLAHAAHAEHRRTGTHLLLLLGALHPVLKAGGIRLDRAGIEAATELPHLAGGAHHAGIGRRGELLRAVLEHRLHARIHAHVGELAAD